MTEDTVDSVEPRWCAPIPESIVWTAWDDGQYIAFHRPSGITHQVNAATATLITELLAKPQNAESIARYFEQANSEVDWSTHLDEILAMLTRLEQLGLVDRA